MAKAQRCNKCGGLLAYGCACIDPKAPVWSGSVSGGGEAVQACPRAADCGMVLPDALRPAAVVAPVERLPVIKLSGVCRVCGASPFRGECQCGGPSDRERKYSEALARLADAGEYNDRVWSSPEIRAAGSLLRGAAEQLAEGKGWGLIALQTARLNLEVAVQIIGKMEGWATNGE